VLAAPRAPDSAIGVSLQVNRHTVILWRQNRFLAEGKESLWMLSRRSGAASRLGPR